MRTLAQGSIVRTHLETRCARLLTAYLGGAVATHARVDNPLLTHVLFPTYVAAFPWAGLILRDPQLRELLPLRRQS
jgi:hypothetical protein